MRCSFKSPLLRKIFLSAGIFLLSLPITAYTHLTMTDPASRLINASSSFQKTSVSVLPAKATLRDGGNLVGTLSGKFHVNPEGNAEYDIPLAAVPGTAGLAPSLSLHYDSSAGNGIVGMGFALQGLTAITRASSTLAQNGVTHAVDFTSADRFALNGQQLVSMGAAYGSDGAEYRTYIDSQARVVSHGTQGSGPASFVVQTKGGQTAWYGTTPDAQIRAQGKDSVAVWALSKIQDQAGNYILYHYTQDPDNGMYYPSEIDYTGNDAAKLAPYASVKFVYENRPDPITKYTAGSIEKTTQRLKAIQTYYGSAMVAEYRLSYEESPNTFRSRVTSLQQCDGNGACLPPLRFTWQTNEMGWTEASQWKFPEQIVQLNSDPHEPNVDMGFMFMDLQGHGKPDIAVARNYDINTDHAGYAQSYFNTGNGWQAAPAAFVLPGPLVTTAVVNHQQVIPGHLFDFEGNGRVQGFSYPLPMNKQVPPDQRVLSYELASTGWVPSQFNLYNDVYPYLGVQAFLPDMGREPDVRGDGAPVATFSETFPSTGKADQQVAYAKLNGHWQNAPAYAPPTFFFKYFINSGMTNDLGLRLTTVDSSNLPGFIVANDLQQKVWRDGQVDPSGATASNWTPAPYNVPNNFRFVMGGPTEPAKDAGGRIISMTETGLSDLVMARDGNHQNWINTGAGWVEGPSGLNPPTDIVHTNGYDSYNDGVIFADVTGSGLPAWLQCSGATYGGACHAWLNVHGQWVEHDEYAPQAQVTDNNGKDNGVRFVDLLGTGFTDMVISNGNQSDVWLNKAQTKPDMMTQVQDPLGDHLQIQYKPLTDSSVYTKGTHAQYPNLDVQAPLYVVSQTASDTEITPTTIAAIATKLRGLLHTNVTQHITTYHYANAVINHLGWNFLGFGEMTTTDQSTGISTTITYSQDYANHTQGMPTGTVTRKADGTIINQEVSTLATKSYGNGQLNGSWYFPYEPQTTVTGYDFNSGVQMSTKTTNTQLDDFGNPTDILEVATDSTGTYTTETKNTYLNLTDNQRWWLGQLMQAQVTASSVASPSWRGALATKPSMLRSGWLRDARHDGPSLARTTSYTYDTHTGVLTGNTLATLDSPQTLSKNYTRDVFGNIIQTTISGSDIPTRTESVMYDAQGRFITAKTNALNQSTHYVTDPQFGVVTQTTDSNNLSETSTLDTLGRVIAVTHPDGTVTTTSYQWSAGDASAPAGSVYKVITTQAGFPMKIVYHDALDRVIGEAMQGFVGSPSSRNAAQPWIWQLTNYDELGRVVGKTLPFYAGDPIYLTAMEYDGLGRVIKTSNPDGNSITQRYDGYSITTTNAKGQSTTRTKNVRDNLMQVKDPENHTTTYTYDAFNNMTSMTDSAGHTSTMVYDTAGHKIQMNDVDRGTTHYTYDALGEMLSQTDAKNQTTSFQYDLAGRMIARTDNANTPNAVTSTWTYDTAPNGIGKLAKEDGVSGILSEVRNTTIARILPSLRAKQSNPSASERLAAAHDHLVVYEKDFSYDDKGRPSQTTMTLQGQTYTTSQTYDAFGRPDITTSANGLQTQNHYDAAGYATQITNAQTGAVYSTINSQNAAGKVTSLTHSNGLTTNTTYDPKTTFLTDIETVPSRALGLEQQVFPQLAPVEDHTTHWQLNVPHAVPVPLAPQAGRGWRATPGEGTTSPLQSLHYDYDALGNPISKTDKVLNVQDTYRYDDLNRLTEDQIQDNTHGQLSSLTYAYDPLGNITDKSDVGHYTYGNATGPHAVTQITGLENDAFQYDANGNQTHATMNTAQGTLKRDITYTSFDLPSEIVQTNNNDTASVSFLYDANRKRIQREDTLITSDPITKKASTTQTTTLYLDGMEIDTTADPTGKITTTTKNYIGDTEIITDAAGTRTQYDILKDNLGSTSVITDQSGNAAQRFHYDPFGEQQLVDPHASPIPMSGVMASSQSGRGHPDVQHTSRQQPLNGAITKASHSNEEATSLTRYGFTGQEEVNVGTIDLIHMNGRMYDPHLGRFLSADLTIQDPTNSQSLNRYSYCINNPLALTDPSGFSFFGDLFDDIFGFVGDVFDAIGDIISSPICMTVLTIAVGGMAIAGTGLFAGISSSATRFALAAAFNGIASYAQTGDIGLGLQTAAMTLLSEYAWVAVGDATQGASMVSKSLAHGFAGGSLNVIQGGSFKNGFLSAVTSQVMSGPIGKVDIEGSSWGTIMARGTASGVIGGTVAATTGGNFENGMMTSAFGEMFNDCLHSYSHHYKDAKALATAMGPNAIVWGERSLDLLPAAYDPDFFVQGTNFVLNPSDFQLGLFHEEIFWTDVGSNLYSVGFFRNGGLVENSENSNVRMYAFQEIQKPIFLINKEMFYLPGFTEKTYSLVHNNCQVYGEKFRDKYGFSHY